MVTAAAGQREAHPEQETAAAACSSVISPSYSRTRSRIPMSP